MPEIQLDTQGQDRRDLLASVLIGVFALACLPSALFSDIWIDEFYSISTTDSGIREAIEESYSAELLPPAYFVFLTAWRALDSSVPFMRLLSVLIVVGALWLTDRAARRWCPRVPVVIVLAPLAVNPHLIYAATEIRPYSLTVLCCALLLWLFHRAYLADARSIRLEIGYGIAAAFALYTYYHLGFLLAAGGAVLALTRRWAVLVRYLVCMAVVAAAAAPQVPMILAGLNTLVQTVSSYVSPLGSFRTVSQLLISLPFGLFSYQPWVRWLVGIAIVAMCAASVWIGRRRVGPNERSLWILVVVLVVGFTGITILNGQTVFPRHFGFAVIPIWFSIAGALALNDSWRARVLPVVATATVAMGAIASYWTFADLTKGGNFRAAARYLESHEAPGQPILVLASYSEGPLRFYYRGINELVPVPGPVRYDEYRPETWRIESDSALAERVEAATRGADSFWVFTDHRPEERVTWLDLDLEFHRFERYLDEHAELVGPQYDLKISTIRHYRRKSP